MLTQNRVTRFLLTALALLMFAAVVPLLSHASDAGAANWTKLSPATSPTVRFGQAMAYDPVSKKIVLFGGFGQKPLNDTWTFDGTAWSHENTPIAPPARTGSAMGFDKRTQKLMMFGGFNGGHSNSSFLNDTWLWDGATSTWTEAKMKASPPRGTGAVMFTDPLSGHAIMFGGYNPTKKVVVYGTTWRWTGTAWHKLHPNTQASPRAWGIAALDPARKNVVLTGGEADLLRTDNTWTWDGKTWTLQSPSTQIPAMTSAGIAFDADSRLIIVFGGWGGDLGQDSDQTWSWDGTNWVQLSPARSPAARDSMGMAYDPNNHQVVMFGGEDVSTGKEMRDTWTWTGK
jgi:hypothetical protein